MDVSASTKNNVCICIESEMVGTAQLKHNCGSFVEPRYVGAAVGLARRGSY